MNEIDWKKVSSSSGYISLKAAYIKDVQDAAKQKRPMRKKEEFLKQFNWVICRAKHYSKLNNEPIENILNKWEKGRDYWWLNYYQDSRQPKNHSYVLKPWGANGVRKNAKKWHRNDPTYAKSQVLRFLMSESATKSAKVTRKDKPRWGMRKKKAQKRREYLRDKYGQ